MSLNEIRRLLGLIFLVGVALPAAVLAANPTAVTVPDLTGSWMGILSLVIFFAAYVLIISVETIRLRKSKPIMVAAGFIWLLVAIAFNQQGLLFTCVHARELDLYQPMVQ